MRTTGGHKIWSARTCPRFVERDLSPSNALAAFFARRRPAERGPALATGRQCGQSGDKSPHSKSREARMGGAPFSEPARNRHSFPRAGSETGAPVRKWHSGIPLAHRQLSSSLPFLSVFIPCPSVVKKKLQLHRWSCESHCVKASLMDQIATLVHQRPTQRRAMPGCGRAGLQTSRCSARGCWRTRGLCLSETSR